MITLIYSKHGRPINDFEIEAELEDLVKSGLGTHIHIKFSSLIFLEYARAWVAEGKILPNEIEVVIEGFNNDEPLSMDIFGSLELYTWNNDIWNATYLTRIFIAGRDRREGNLRNRSGTTGVSTNL